MTTTGPHSELSDAAPDGLNGADRSVSEVRRVLGSKVGLVHDLRELIVLYALEQSGRTQLLAEAERALVRQRRADIRAALSELESGGDILARIASDAALLERELSTSRERAAVPEVVIDTDVRHPERFGRVTASVLALAAFVVLLLMVLSGDGSRTLHTDAGSEARVAFEDGTVIKLMPESRLEYRTDDSGRRPRSIDLEGAAFFTVARAEIPVVVETSTARIVVVGTEFGIRSEKGTSEIVLVSGRITVSGRRSPNRGVVVTPGQATRVEAGGEPVTPYAVDVSQRLEWANLFVFQGELLSEIVGEFSLHFGVGVALDETLRDEVLTATFDRSADLEQILDIVCAAAGCTVVDSDSGFALKVR